MCARQLHLSWKDHNGALVSVFDKLLERNSLVDCTLAAEGQYLKAHKVVLSACSSYFELLFNQESERNPIVILKDVKFQELKAAVTFMYRGEVEVSEDRLAAFLELSDSLKIKGLGSEGAASVPKQKDAAKDEFSISLFPCKRKASGNPGQSTEENPVVPINESSNSNNSSSQYVPPERIDSSHTISSSSTYNFMPNEEKCSDQDNLESLLSTSEGVSEEEESHNEIPVLKTEPIVHPYQEHTGDDAESDFGDDVCMIDGGDNWTDHNLKTVEDLSSEQDKNLQDQFKKEVGPLNGKGLSAETSLDDPPWNEDQRFSSLPIKEEDPGPSTWEQANRNLMDAESGLSIGADGVELASSGAKESRAYGQYDLQVPNSTNASFNEISTESLLVSDLVYSEKELLGEGLGFSQFKCRFCDYCTSVMSTYKSHMRIHKTEKRFKCDQCGYAARRMHEMKKHYFIHTGEKPFKCPLCTYGAIQRVNLQRHIKSVHKSSGEESSLL